MKSPDSGKLAATGVLLFVLLVGPLWIVYPSNLSSDCLGGNEGTTITAHAAQLAGCMPWRLDLWESAGKQALQAGQAQAAVEFFERAQAMAARLGRPTFEALSPEGQSALGEAYQQSGNIPAALRQWKTALALGRLSSEQAAANALKLAQSYQALGNYPAAIGFWNFLVDLRPQEAQIRYQLGLLQATQAPEMALVTLDEAARLDNQYEATTASLRRAVLSARFAESPAYTLLATGRALATLEHWNLAAEAFRQATLQRPDYAEAWAYWGEALQHPHEGEQAAAGRSDGLAELQKAVALGPKSLAAQTFLSLYWMRRGRYDQALETIRRALELQPTNPVLMAGLADAQAASGDREGAYQAYQQAAALAPYDPQYLRLQVSFSLRYHYRTAEIALPVARKLVIQAANDPTNLDLMAQVLIYQGDLANAQRFLGRALAANPDFPPARLHLGLLYLLQGKQAAAAQEFQRTIALSPGSPEAAQAQQLLARPAP